MYIVSTLLRGVFSQREFVRESDARVCFWNFIAVMPNDGDGDDVNRNGVDHDGHDWGVTFLIREVRETPPEEENWRDLEGMICALAPSTHSVTSAFSPDHTRGTITVRSGLNRAEMWVQTNTVEDTLKVRVNNGGTSKVVFEGSQCDILTALSEVRKYYALRG